MASSLKLKQEESEPEDPRCPSCGASLPEGAVLCVQCGYDFRSGRRVDEEAAPRANPLMVAGVSLLVAIAAGLLAWRMLGSEPPAVPAIPPPTPAPVVVAEVAPVATPVEQPTQVVMAVEAETQTVAAVESPVPVAETNQVPDVPALDPAVVEAEQRAAVAEQLDIKAPMFTEGEAVELRYTNGVVQRGVFLARQAEGLTLQTASNMTRAVDYVLLDRGSRVRSDPHYRERYIDFHTQQRTQKILQQEMAPSEAP